MTTNLRTEKLLASVISTVGLAWATRRPTLPTVTVDPKPEGWVIEAADALALAWASRR